MIDFRVYAKAFMAGGVSALIGALTAVSLGETKPLALLAAAAGGFVAGFGSVYAIPNKTV